MLILTRNPQQKIIINDNIEVIYVSYSGESIRLGFNAPKDVKIMRSELVKEESIQLDCFNR